ncbi:Calmodulin-regulated spectrin-associated 1 [Brachionus plicatilis]|uniref:Calmodulin-regulated spectrin-associated 1 n=1 Tax=Brachionus plicatilis TaxID=10195 RepID=A0A3M7SSU4_BRAPC|nr:Calmodulin-regulated spectrin-associated 1 [Brachionus plicatilis]
MSSHIYFNLLQFYQFMTFFRLLGCYHFSPQKPNTKFNQIFLKHKDTQIVLIILIADYVEATNHHVLSNLIPFALAFPFVLVKQKIPSKRLDLDVENLQKNRNLILTFNKVQWITGSKTNDDKSDKQLANTTNNLLMTAVKDGNSPANANQRPDDANQLANDGHEGDLDANDADSFDYKQRKRELIIQKQMERRQQQEMRRMQLEEERAQKAEELRQKEEELAVKKMIEKSRKETIFQAYIDKKKQSEVESMSGCFGPPNSLINAKKFHSTNRLKPSAKSNTQNLFDQFDQASIYSERSATGHYSSNTMVKSK